MSPCNNTVVLCFLANKAYICNRLEFMVEACLKNPLFFVVTRASIIKRLSSGGSTPLSPFFQSGKIGQKSECASLGESS